MADGAMYEEARRELGLLQGELSGALRAPAADRDLIAVALNERFSELGLDHPLPYSGDQKSDEP